MEKQLMITKDRLRNCWRSVTVWFNGAVGTLMLILPIAQASFPQMEGYLSEDLYKAVMAVVIAANIILRFKTTADLAEKGKK